MGCPNPTLPRHENPNPLPVAPSSSQSHLRSIISTLLSFPDTSLSSLSPFSIDQALDQALATTSDDVSVQNNLTNHILAFSSLLQESCLRKQASVHNSISWPLPPDLTSKAFSKLDTKSLIRAMGCCTMFQKNGMDPLCYSHINLTTSIKNFDKGLVSTMISRATNELRFLELGHVDRAAETTTSLLTVDCLLPLSRNLCFIGKCLRSLHLYNVIYSNNSSCFSGLSACSNLTDLKIVGLHSPCENLLKSITTNYIEQLFLDTFYFQEQDLSALFKFLKNIPNITSLTLIGFRLNDATVQTLADSCGKLQYMNFSKNSAITGRFLRDLGHSFEDGPLKTLILSNCSSLEETEVVHFINSISTGNFRFIEHIEVSNNCGLVSNGGNECYNPNFPVEKLKETRPDVTFVANFQLASLDDSSDDWLDDSESDLDYSDDSLDDSDSDDSSDADDLSDDLDGQNIR